MLLTELHDPMGTAIYDYHRTGMAAPLLVHSSMFEDDEIPVSSLFRDFGDMPVLERIAPRWLKDGFWMLGRRQDVIPSPCSGWENHRWQSIYPLYLSE